MSGCPFPIPGPPKFTGNELGHEPSVGHLRPEHKEEESLLHLSKPSQHQEPQGAPAGLEFLLREDNFTNMVAQLRAGWLHLPPWL